MRWAALVIALLLVSPAGAGDPQAAVDAYTRALETAEPSARRAGFRAAQRLFEQLIAAGAENADLYANLGNAALQAEQLGAAILAYRRALRIDPDHTRALQNLEYARSLLPAWVPRVPPEDLSGGVLAWHRALSAQERAVISAVLFLLAALLVAAGIALRQSALRNAALVPGAVWLALLVSVTIEARAAGVGDAVVIAEEAVLRVADSALAPAALPRPLPAGAELRVLELRSPWLHVRLPSGRDAWLPEAAAARIRQR